jgi:subtilisin-like proprotein convertase family protein
MPAAMRRARWLVAATVATTAVLSPVGGEPANAADTTFTQSAPISVGDAGSDPFPSTLDVTGLSGDVVDLDVTLTGLTHSWPSDLDVVLVAPDGTAATVMSDLGGDDQTPAAGGTLTFDDDATATAPLGLASGRYLPQDDDTDPTDPDLEGVDATFADLATSTSPNGTWALYVADDGWGDDGGIASWSLTFHLADPPVITAPAYGSLIGGSTIPVHGTGTPGASIHVRLDQQTLQTVTVAPDGSWATDFTRVADGSHTVTATNSRANGAAASTSVRLDGTAPTGTLVLRTVRGGPETTSSRRVYLDVAANEPLRGIRVSNDGAPLGALQAASGTIPWLLTDHDGTRRVFVQLEDLAGNVSQGYISDTVALDRVAPRVLRTSPTDGAVRVRRDKAVTARFNDFVTPNAGTSLGYLARIFRVGTDRPVRAVVRYDASAATVRVLPNQLLRRNTRYQVVVGGFHDPAGNFLDQDPTKAGSQQKVWRFRTR